MEKSKKFFIANPASNMPCFIHKRCASVKGCPETVTIMESSSGLIRHDCSKCEFDKGSCLDCYNLNDYEECPFPYRCKECDNYAHLGDYGICSFMNERVNPNFFCAGWELTDELKEIKREETS